MYPQNIPKLKDHILKIYQDSLVQPGEMVGIIAASSIGADTTQQSLNSFHSVSWDTDLIMFMPFLNNTIWPIRGKIGNIIDKHFKDYGFQTKIYTGIVENDEKNPYVQIADVTENNLYVPSVDQDGNVTYKKVLKFIRHPDYTKLIKVTTWSGKSVKATSGYSFLAFNEENKIVQILGSQLSHSDFIPIAYKIDDTKFNENWLNKWGHYFELTYETGNLVGFFLLHGFLTTDWIHILHHKKITDILDNLQIEYHVSGVYIKFQNKDIYLIFTEFKDPVKNEMDDNDDLSKIPDFVFVSNIEFLKGFLDGIADYEAFLPHIEQNVHFLNMRVGKIIGSQTVKSVVKDEVYLIEDVVNDSFFVYDLEVEETENFIVNGNICMRDSSGLGNKANITSGLVRQQELLNASKNVKTPSCQIYFDETRIDTKDLFKVMEFCHSNIIYYELENIIKDIKIEKNPDMEPEEEYYDMFEKFYDDTFRDAEYRVRLILDLEKLYRIKKSTMWITTVIYSILDKCEEHLSIVFFPTSKGVIDIFVKDALASVEDMIKQISKKKGLFSNKKMSQEEKTQMNQNYEDIIYKYLNDDNKLLFFIKSIIVPTIKRIPVSGIFGIEECYYEEGNDGWFVENTKGSNLKELLIHPFVKPEKTTSNNMWDIYECFGIEASHSFLVNEFKRIISVNRRHLDIMIDSMTASGKIMAVSRYGIDRKQVGPLSKACFEQPVENFLISATKGESDYLKGVTSNVCLGKLNKMGTGMCDLMVDIGMYNKMASTRSTQVDIVEEEEEKVEVEDDETYLY